MAGHAHLQMGWKEGLPTLGIYDFEAGAFPADAFPFVVGSAGVRLVPPGAQFAFLGEAGSTFFVLPQDEHPDLTYLGIGVDPIPVGTPAASQIRLRLVSVAGPGHFAAYQVGSFGQSVAMMNSRDGIHANDGIDLAPGAHEHMNWAFNAPGDYQITFVAQAVRQSTGQMVLSLPTTYRFRVVPPSGARVDIELGRLPGNLRFLIHSRVGARLEWQESSNLTEWITKSSRLLASDKWEFDVDNGGLAPRFWRVREHFE